MTEINKANLFGVLVSITNRSQACAAIISAGRARQSFAVTALAVHGLVEGMRDPGLARAINSLDLVTPDGQPVRWALNLLHAARLEDRTCGPDLTLQVCQRSERERIPIYIFGSTSDTCARLVGNLKEKFPDLRIAGVQPDRFREATVEEDRADVHRINTADAGIVLVVRGCPRQEYWVAQHKGTVRGAMLAVGAAADFLAGNLKRGPAWMQACGLEWLYRLAQEPRRLAKRYATTNTIFLLALGKELGKRWLGFPPSVSCPEVDDFEANRPSMSGTQR